MLATSNFKRRAFLAGLAGLYVVPLLRPYPADASGISVVQSKIGGLANVVTNPTTLSVTLTSAPTAANLLIGMGGTDSVSTAAESGFTVLDSSNTNWGVMSEYRVVQSGDSATQPVITKNSTTNAGMTGILYEITGQATSSFINQHNHSNSTTSGTGSGNTVTTGSITPSVNGCLIIAGVFYDAGSSGSGSVTVGGSFTLDQKLYENGVGFASIGASASFVQATAAAVSATFTCNNVISGTACDTFIIAIAPAAAANFLTRLPLLGAGR